MTSRRYTADLTLYWGDSEVQTGEADVTVSFTIAWGRPATGPSYSSGGEPAEPDEIDDVRIESVHGTPWAEVDYYPSYGRTEAEARETLVEKVLDDHYEELVEAAIEQDQPDPDDERDRRLDDEMWERQHDQPLWIEGDD